MPIRNPHLTLDAPNQALNIEYEKVNLNNDTTETALTWLACLRASFSVIAHEHND